jgi:hypothetical protein
MRNGFKKWNRKVTGSVSGKWTKELLDSVEVLRLIPLERMAMNYHIDADHILRSFTWFTTPQGHEYWNDLHIKHCDEGPQPLPREAVEFCKELLENAIEKRIC